MGSLLEGGLAPAVLAIVERGVRLRPAQARTLGIEVELAIADGYPPVRIVFEEHAVLVEDGAASPDLRIHGALPDLIHLMVSPALGGVPAPINARGRAALVMVARRRVRVEGGIGLMRRFLGIVRI